MVMILVVEITAAMKGMEILDQDKLAERFPASASFFNSSL
jgi:hypothetical protein